MRRTIITVTTTTTEVVEEGGEEREPEEEAREVAPWRFWRKGVRRPKGCRCLKTEFKERGCDGVQCRRRWTQRYNSPVEGWFHIVLHLARWRRQGVFWAGLGHFRNAVKEYGQLVNAEVVAALADRA